MNIKREVFEYKWAVEQRRKASRVNIVNKDNPFRTEKPFRPGYKQQINDATISWKADEVRSLLYRASQRLRLVHDKSLLIDKFNSSPLILVKQKSRVINKRSSISILKNICSLTGRGSSVIRKYLVSRFMIRSLVRFGLVRGLMHERSV